MAKEKTTIKKKKIPGDIEEIYIRISRVKGKDKDTIAHSAKTKEEAIEFISKFT